MDAQQIPTAPADLGSELPAGFTLEQPQAAPSTPEMPAEQPADMEEMPEVSAALPAGFQLEEEKYGTPLETVKTVGEAAGRGLAGPAFTAAEVALGVPKAEILGREAAHPILAPVTEAAALVLPTVVSAGVSAEARTALEAASRFTLPGIMKAAENVIPKAGTTIASQIGTAAAKSAISGALLAGSDEASKMILGDPNTTAESALLTMGGTAALTGLAGGVLGAVPALWRASASSKKLAQEVANFHGETKFNFAYPDHVSALSDELTQLHKAVTEPASEVYGAQGLKAEAMKKLVPELNDAMVAQTDNIVKSFEKAADSLRATADPYLSRLEGKLDTLRAGLNTTDSVELFNNLQSVKQILQDEADYAKIPGLAEKDYINAIKGLAKEIRVGLEDTGAWGKAAELQQGVNSAFKAYLPSLQKFESTFMTKIPNVETGAIEKQINPGKVSTFINQLGKPSAEIKQTFLENFIKASERYKGEIDKIHDVLGIDSPIKPVSMAVINHALETPTFGSKMAKLFYGKALSDAGATALAGTVGEVVGKPLGIPHGLSALLGVQAVGPFFKSVLPAIAKNFINNPEASGVGAKAAIDYATNAVRGMDLINKAAKNMFVEGAEAVSKDYLPTDKDRAKMEKVLASLAENPQQAFPDVSDLSHYMSDHAAAQTYAASGMASALQQMKPIVAKAAPLDPQPVLSSAQKAQWKTTLDIAQQPLVIMHKAKNGTLTAQDMATATRLYPNAVKQMQTAAANSLTNHIAKGKTIPYQMRQSLSILLGQPMDSTMKPASIQAAQMANTKGQAQQPGGMPGAAQPARSQGVKSSPALQKMPNMYKTPGQSRNIRMLKD